MSFASSGQPSDDDQNLSCMPEQSRRCSIQRGSHLMPIPSPTSGVVVSSKVSEAGCRRTVGSEWKNFVLVAPN